MLNVDPKRADDQFYRYKMPRIQVKVESGGNGIKTVIPNIEQVAGALHRDVQLPMKYMGQHIGSSAKLKDSKWMLMGKVEREEVQKLIFDFIEKFVLCKECRNPETIIQVDDEKYIWLNCKACSRVTGVDQKDKLCALIIKTEQPVPMKRNKREEKRKPEKTKDQKEEEAFNKAARQVQDGDVIEDDSPEKPNPIEVLKKFLSEGHSENDVVHHIFGLKQDYGLNDRHVVSLVFEALFDENIKDQIKPRAKLMKRVLKTDTERDLIINLMCLCKEKESLKPKFAILLKTFYDEEVLSEKAILEWFEDAKLSKLIKKDEQLNFKEKCKPFITWLKEAEDDEDDEEDEEESD